MKQIVLNMMEQIEEECKQDGYYPDLQELFEMAIARLQDRTDDTTH